MSKDLSDFKKVMFASLRSLLPSQWNMEHENVPGTSLRFPCLRSAGKCVHVTSTSSGWFDILDFCRIPLVSFQRGSSLKRRVIHRPSPAFPAWKNREETMAFENCLPSAPKEGVGVVLDECGAKAGEWPAAA